MTKPSDLTWQLYQKAQKRNPSHQLFWMNWGAQFGIKIASAGAFG